MLKLDIEATLAEIRKAMEAIAAIPGQDACEVACNRDGMAASLEFALWHFHQREKLEACDLADATGMLLCGMLVGSLGAYAPEDQADACNQIMMQLMVGLERHFEGVIVPGDAVVAPITRDVGDC